jgi:hypothetical protein
MKKEGGVLVGSGNLARKGGFEGDAFLNQKAVFILHLLIMCIVVDICDTPPARHLLGATLREHFFHFPPAGPQTKGLVKSLDFPTQFVACDKPEKLLFRRGLEVFPAGI